MLPQNFLITSAAVNAAVYEYSPMLEDRGNIYYIQTVQGKEYSYGIYRLEVATGNKTRLISSKNDILGMMIHNDTLYYSSYDGEKDVYHTYSISVDAKNKKTICNGYFLCLDDSSIYYTIIKGEESKIYKRSYDSKKVTLIYTGNMTFSFVKNLDNTLYFTQFDEASSKLTLYTLMPEQTKLAFLTTEKITLDGSERTFPKVSDVAFAFEIPKDAESFEIIPQITAYEKDDGCSVWWTEKCGMKYEGTLRMADWNNQGICDVCYYALLVSVR